MKSLLNQFYKSSKVWIKLYENEKEKNIMYKISRFKQGFIVTAYHMGYEPKCRNCIVNHGGTTNPCICTSEYMHLRCMAKTYNWVPKDTQSFYAVLKKLGEFENKFGDFSQDEILEIYKDFCEIFESEEKTKVHFEEISSNPSFCEMKSGNITYKFVFER